MEKSEELNQKQRMDFVRYWANFVRNNPDQEWSQQQNVLINSMLKSAKQFSREEFLKNKENFINKPQRWK